MSKFSKLIEKRGWRHDRFLLVLALVLMMGVLSFTVVLLGLVSSGRIDQTTLRVILQNTGMWLVLGMISGLLTGFALLVRPYRKQQWDLHKVVPEFLIFFLTILLMTLIIEQFWNFDVLYQSSFNIGFGLGGLLPVIAYSAEVAKEHPEFL